ncbi:tetratricopeptide repeat protein [Candidatus Poribacteria bacterium]|nr:tetratricopeptide repeat protein [Candidatus Poribacteria bacterium]MYB64301.1 tetratricopeptide repeat protein [Candidatus Poribacteria bacterium]MYF56000.1 tetratricopeptide repeat protein [Candidatus Poribacteria bacterium]MYI92794.1 tetratricopeptide repeat protein [Candidatus Poribacteria bacterium]
MQQTHTSILLCSVFVLMILIGCASHDVTSTKDYNQFAIKAAQAGLWNEAIFRWKQVVSIDPDNAAAHNNLGVGYEAMGKIAEAKSAYQRATELEPNSKYYRINYRRCRLHIRRSGTDNDEISSEPMQVPEDD